jgi:hypothetical protein
MELSHNGHEPEVNPVGRTKLHFPTEKLCHCGVAEFTVLR